MTSAASGGQSKRILSEAAAGNTQRVAVPVFLDWSFLMLSGDVGEMPLALDGDVGGDNFQLLISGDQYEARDTRVAGV